VSVPSSACLPELLHVQCKLFEIVRMQGVDDVAVAALILRASLYLPPLYLPPIFSQERACACAPPFSTVKRGIFDALGHASQKQNQREQHPSLPNMMRRGWLSI
jgi:hypothetical protein